MKVTVIVATYNQQDTIGRTLDSILAQQVDFPYEILIGEDCSSDDTRRICLEYQQKFPETIRLMPIAPNKGIVDNYFDCILAAHGEYIADCAGDDYWIDPLKLKKQVKMLDANPNVSLCHTDWIYDKDGINIPREPVADGINKKIVSRGELVIPLLAHENMPIIHLCTAMYRRSLITDLYNRSPHLFRKPEYTCEDFQIEVMMASAGEIAYIPDVTLAYSVGHNSISHPINKEKTLRYYQGTLCLTHTLSEALGKESSPRIAAYYSRTIRYMASVVFMSGNKMLRDIFNETTDSFAAYFDFKTRIYITAMRHTPLWKILRLLHHGR